MHIYQPRNSYPLIKGKCHASVRSGNSFFSHQCNRKAVVTKMYNDKKHDFCKTHDPDAVAARRAASQEKFEKSLKARMLPLEKAAHYEKVLIRIANIEHGNLDAVKHAKRALAKFKVGG